MTSKLIQDGPEKTFALVFDTGEEVVAGLVQFARDYKLSSAHLTAIGAFERVTLGFFDVAKKDYKRIAIEEQVELMSLVGNIAEDDQGNPKLHAHVVVGKSDGSAHGGHLLDAYVRPTLEVVVVEASQHLRRTMRDELGLACWICRHSGFDRQAGGVNHQTEDWDPGGRNVVARCGGLERAGYALRAVGSERQRSTRREGEPRTNTRRPDVVNNAAVSAVQKRTPRRASR